MTDDREKRKSLSRSKKSVYSMIDIFGPEILNAIVPGAGLAYRVGKVLVTHASDFYRDRTEGRFLDFHEALIAGKEADGVKELLGKPLSMEDYHALLDAALHDQEDAKAPFYGSFFRALVEGSVPEEYRVHLIKSLKELTASDLELLRRIYITSRHDFVNRQGRSELIRAIIVTKDPLRASSIQTFVRLGFLTSPEKDLMAQFTALMETMVTTLYTKDQLTPEAIGERAWKDIGTVFVVVPDIDKYGALIMALEGALKEMSVRSSNVRAQKQEPHPNVLASPGLVVCLDHESGAKDSDMSYFLNDPRVRHKRIVKILVSASEEGVAHDPFREIEAMATFDFTSPGRYELDQFKKFVSKITG